MVSKGVVTGITLKKSSEAEFCSACIQGKAHHKVFPKESETTYTVYGDKVVVDLWGPVQVNLLGGHHYYQLYHDMFTYEDHIDFLKWKSKAFERYLKYEAWVKVQRNAIIKCLDSDGGEKYISKEFTDHLEQTGMVCHLTVHGSPQSNSMAEQGNRTHIERACAMLIATGLPKFLWAEAVHHSVWLGVRTPFHALPEFITPFEKATGHKPNLRGVLEWGILIWVKKPDAGKLDLHAVEGRFVGYDKEAKGYWVFWAARCSVSIKWDIYVDKDAVLEPRDIMFEGGNLPTINATSPEVSNPTVPDSQSNEDTPPPAEMPTINPSPTPEMSNLEPSTTSKVQQCRNSLAGLPQFDEATYGHRKRRSGKDAAFVENMLAVDAKGILEPGGCQG